MSKIKYRYHKVNCIQISENAFATKFSLRVRYLHAFYHVIPTHFYFINHHPLVNILNPIISIFKTLNCCQNAIFFCTSNEIFFLPWCPGFVMSLCELQGCACSDCFSAMNTTDKIPATVHSVNFFQGNNTHIQMMHEQCKFK